MSVSTPAVPRDEMAEAEVQRLARQRYVFNTWVAVGWAVIFVLIIGFFLFVVRFDGAFLFNLCVATVGRECAPGSGPSGTFQVGSTSISWNGWIFFIAAGIPMTLFVSAVSISLAIVFALLGALGRLSKNPVFFGPATFYISLFRGVPLLVQIFFWYLALPQVKIPYLLPDGIVLPPVPAGILALAACYGAYMSETFRAGIQSIPKGQIEAAQALGMTHRQMMVRVILPQALRVVIPPIGNDFVTMTKDSSMVYFMGVWELLFRANRVGRQNFRNFETLVLAAVFYWIMTIILQSVQARIEAYLARGER